MGSRLESNSNAVRKRIENHTFDDEEGEEYKGSRFGGFSDYFRRKKIKLQNLDHEIRSSSSTGPPIFRGVVAHVNGYTQPSLNDLHKLIVSHGGGFMQYLDGKTTVTHIIASNLTPKKAVEFKRYRIVKPAWVVESVKAGKILPWDAFRVLDEGAGQKVLGFDNGKVISQASSQSRGYKEQTDGSWYMSQLKGGPSAPPSSQRPAFLSQAPPTPDDDDGIHDLPPSRQQECGSLEEEEAESDELAKVFAEAQDQTHLESPPDTSPVVKAAERQDTQDQETGEQPAEHFSRPDLKRKSTEHRSESPSKRQLTTEEHNAILLSDPHIRKSSVVNPDFLEQYYRESRLHHLSTWKADLKAQLQALAASTTPSQKQRQKRPPGARRYILHVDFDSFFAAVSLKKHPQYKDKPAVVAHGGGTGSEIASCNYPARAFGVKNGMWMKRALEMCPELKILPYDFPAYEEASRAFYDAILALGGVVQSVSVDEALVDITTLCLPAGGTDGVKRSEGGQYLEQAKADGIALRLREDIKRRTDCDVSVGIGGNILLAKVALRKAKPAGQYQIKPEEVLDFIGELEVQNLPGVAHSIGGKLEEIGIKLVKDIREFSRERLISTLGPKTGEKVWEYARGIDRVEVGDQIVRKSVSAEVNWGVRFENQAQTDEFIECLCGELSKRLLKEGVKGRQLTMKLMRRAPDAPLDPPKHLGHGKCDTYNKSVVLGVATNAKDVLTKEALSILKGFGFSPGELRGIGVQMTKLEPLKGTADGQLESSQRRLQFKADKKPKPAVKEPEDPIADDIETPKKPKAPPDQVVFGAEQLNHSSPSRKPLNTLGTQFILPTQVDPKVLAELPEDIRTKLAKHVTSLQHQQQFAPPSSPSKAPTKSLASTLLPNQSQLDPSILAALPPSVRAEILAFYSRAPSPSPKRPRTADQFILPQSPRKVRTVHIQASKKIAPPPLLKRGRGRPPRALENKNRDGSNSTLTQSNFIPARRLTRQLSYEDATTPGTTDTEGEGDAAAAVGEEEVSAEFLAALPEDIRREVLDEQRRARLKRKAGLDLGAAPARKRARPVSAGAGAAAPAQAQSMLSDGQALEPGAQRVLRLEPRPPRPRFTTKKLWRLEDLRRAIRQWYDAFGAEGPYEEDVDALVVYLGKVVGEERDMAKAVAVVKWMAWVLDEGGGPADGNGDGFRDGGVKVQSPEWAKALDRIKQGVQEAVEARGLGKVDL
ncbi:deoxycytidyl transferase [Coniosporium apollinis]|uniref:Deoxycytidyl transferase n=1 Tax=Coniosporium apollinis TaxID=61459 RepID=A0ABQ9NZR7_9PEZI|nr:deoxycytidyl transferase [Coniosporium apollinis]